MAKLIDSIKSFVKEKILKNAHVRENIKSDYVLETRNLGITFGGLKAAQTVNIKIKKNQIKFRLFFCKINCILYK